MKPATVAAMIGVAESTLRRYANDYGEYLSPTGAGGGRKHRDFTEHDVRVLKLIADMKAERTSDEDIDVTLRSLESTGWERLPALDENARSIMPAPGALLEAHKQRDVLEHEVKLLRERIDHIEQQADAERQRAQQERDDLTRRLTRAETLLELYESGRLHPPNA